MQIRELSFLKTFISIVITIIKLYILLHVDLVQTFMNLLVLFFSSTSKQLARTVGFPSEPTYSIADFQRYHQSCVDQQETL